MIMEFLRKDKKGFIRSLPSRSHSLQPHVQCILGVHRFRRGEEVSAGFSRGGSKLVWFRCLRTAVENVRTVAAGCDGPRTV